MITSLSKAVFIAVQTVQITQLMLFKSHDSNRPGNLGNMVSNKEIQPIS